MSHEGIRFCADDMSDAYAQLELGLVVGGSTGGPKTNDVTYIGECQK